MLVLIFWVYSIAIGHTYNIAIGISVNSGTFGQGALFYRDSLWYILSPILAITLVQLSLVSFASALEDIFNPRLRGSA